MKDDKQINLQTPYKIKLPACTRKHLNINVTNTGKGNNRRWQAQADSECNERIPPDGFDMTTLEVALRGRIPPPPSGGSPRTERSPLPCGHLPTPWGVTLFKGGLYASLQTPYEIKLPTCIEKHLNININNTGKVNNRRWHALGGQRGTSEFHRTVSTRQH